MAGSLIRSLKKRWRVVRDPEFRQFRRLIRRFNREQGRGTPVKFADVTENAVVFDLGGYEGEWCADMRRLYDCHVHVFEPHPRFAASLAERFHGDAKVTVHAYALGAENGSLDLSDSEDASSAMIEDGPSVSGEIKAVGEVMSAIGADRVAATKINIEGGEYDILPALIETGLIERFASLAIQFHNYSQGDIQHRDDIRKGLEKTHKCVWNYDFVWEKWDRLG